MSFFRGRGRNEEDERITETEQYSTNYDRGYGGGYGGPREDERVTETSTYYSNDIPPPPQVPYPWRPHWHDGHRRYEFINEQTNERTFDFPGRRGYSEETTTTYVDDRGYGGGGYGGGGGGYGGSERVYDQTTTTTETEQRRGGGGHGLMYGAMGAAAGLAGGAFLAHEAGNVHEDYERDKYRVEDDVEDFPENAARWTGEKVQDVEDFPQDVEQGFDRFGNRVESRFDNVADDVEDAPGDVANWAGRKVGDVERFDDNIDNSYDAGKAESRYDDNDRW